MSSKDERATSDFQTDALDSVPINQGQSKTKKRRKRKASKQNPNINQALKKINIEQFISSDHSNDINSYSGQISEKNFSPAYDYNQDFKMISNEYDFTIEELFEEMVCKVGDYFQDSINDLIDNFCYDLLYILDDNSYMEETVDNFCDELMDELKSFFKKVTEKDIPITNFEEEDADSIFEPFSDPFFEVFLDAHDFSEEPPKTTYNNLRKLRSKIQSISRETRKKLENSHLNLTTQLAQIDEIQNLIDRISIQNKSYLNHLTELGQQNYKYLCQSKLLEAEIESISIKSNFFTTTSNIVKKDFDNYTNDDVKTNIEILEKEVQSLLDDQNSFKKELFEKHSQLKKYRNNSNETYKDFVFINGIIHSNLDKYISLSSFNSDVESLKNDNLEPKSVQLRSFEASSFLDFKLKCQKSRMDKEKFLEESQIFIESIKDDNLFYSRI